MDNFYNSLKNVNPKNLNPLLTHTNNHIIIIGNGFDLYCGINSRFKDYIDFEKEKFKVKVLNKQSHCTLYETNFFIRYFENKNKYNNQWNDIESTLYNFIRNDKERFKISYNQRVRADNSYSNKIYYDFDNNYFINNSPKITTSFEEWIKGQFSEFEIGFCKYLKSLTNNEENDNAGYLLEKILNTKNYSHITILDFNYTKMPKEKGIDIIHIHGSIEKENIIIGYDGTKPINDENGFEWSFTKTYRSLDLPYKGEFVLDSKIDRLIFYGHSLGENDYSYFQSLFDYYNIYESRTILEFCYTDYDKNQKEITKQRISKLLQEYGKTLDNKDHGKNLLHKLILEGRLILRHIQGFNTIE